MKLVKGQTLADLLRNRSSPGAERPRFLKIFEQICQTVAYAHARGVIHRDLKPANVMVGAFGEVLVMDWGLAKVLGSDKPSSDTVTAEKVMTHIQVSRTDDASDTREGDVLGTPAYMPPEQALGEIDRLDERSDVFSLGAILCEILTGHRPYSAPTGHEVLRMARRGESSEALARLDACGADAELIALAKRCLAVERDSRPRQAGEVAAAVERYLASVEERARQAEIERAAAQARATAETAKAHAESRARRMTLGLAASVLLLLAAGSAGALLWQRQESQRREANAAVRTTIEQARTLLAAGWEANDSQKLAEAQRAASRAVEIAERAGADDEVKQEAAALHEEVESRLAAAAKNERLLAALLDVGVQPETGTYQKTESGRVKPLARLSIDEQYAGAFRRWGLDADADPTAAAARLAEQPTPVVQEVVASLDAWALHRWQKGRPEAESRRLLNLADAVDRSDRRKELRRLWVAIPYRWTLASLLKLAHTRLELRQLAARVDVENESELGVLALARMLAAFGEKDKAVRLLELAVAGRRDCVVLLSALGHLLGPHEALEYYRTAAALRPDLGVALAHALVLMERQAEGAQIIRGLLQRQPDNPELHLALADALYSKSTLDKELEAIGASLNAKIELHSQKKLDEALAAYRKAIELLPDFPEAHNNLGIVLLDQKELDQAIAEFRKAIVIRPSFAAAHNNLGIALKRQNKPDQAVAAYRKAIELRPDFYGAHCNLAGELRVQKKMDEAEAHYRKAIELLPIDPEMYYYLGLTLHAQKKHEDAVAAYLKAIELRPNYPEVYYNLGDTLWIQDHLKEAVAAYRHAIKLQPNHYQAHLKLGLVLLDQEKPDQAVAAFRKAIEIRSDDANAYRYLGLSLYNQGKVDEIKRGTDLLDQKMLDEVVAAFRKAIELRGDDSEAHFYLGNAMRAQNKLDDAVAAYRKAIDLRHDYVEAYFNLGITLINQKELELAIAQIRNADKLLPNDPTIRPFLQQTEKWLELDRRLPAILAGKEKTSTAREQLAFGVFCVQYRKDYRTAARFFADALATEPKLNGERPSLSRFRAASAASLAAAGKGNDAANLDGKERARLRKQALDWLTAEVAAWAAVVDKGTAEELKKVPETLAHWQSDPDLATLRDKAALAKLPEAERKAFEKLWADVEALLQKARKAP